MNEMINQLVTLIVKYSNELLMPFMLAMFVLGAFLRVIIYFTVRCEYRFAQEFEKRVHRYMAHEDDPEIISSFYRLCKRLLEKTYHEHFELKRKYRRRRFDHVTSVTDRLFLIEDGVVRLIKDSLGQLKYLKKNGKQPKFIEIAKYVFGANPVFNKVFGVFPMGMFNDILNILPGLFVIGGIFGTFVGVMQALPELSHMDIANVEATKKTMDTFLMNMAFSMGTSIVGIVYSVSMTLLNAMLTPETLYINMVNKMTSSLEFLWNETDNNDLAASDMEVPKEDRRGLVYSNEAKDEEGKGAAVAETPAPVAKPVVAKSSSPAPSPTPAVEKTSTVAEKPAFVPKFDRVLEIETIVEEMENPLSSIPDEISESPPVRPVAHPASEAHERVAGVKDFDLSEVTREKIIVPKTKPAPAPTPKNPKLSAPPPLKPNKPATDSAPVATEKKKEEPAASQKLAILMRFKERIEADIRKANDQHLSGQLSETELEEKMGVWVAEKKSLEKDIAGLVAEISKQRAA